MTYSDRSEKWWQLPTSVIEGLTYLLGFGVLLSVPFALMLGQIDALPDSDTTFYVTKIAVPLLTFAGFLAVYLGFRSQESQNAQQEAHFQTDRFESIFFQLLRTQNQIVEGCQCEEWRAKKWALHAGDADIEPNWMRGRICFEQFYSELEEKFDDIADEKNWGEPKSRKLELADENNELRIRIREPYIEFFNKERSQLNHYYDNLSKIISFIDGSNIDDKQFYIDFLVTQMSLPELKLFFYHEVATRESSEASYLDEVREMLKRYTFFKHLTPDALLRKRHAKLNERALGVD